MRRRHAGYARPDLLAAGATDYLASLTTERLEDRIMTTIDTRAPRSTALAFTGPVQRLIAKAAGAVSEHRTRVATYNALRHLDDRELADIGLTRAEVNAMR